MKTRLWTCSRCGRKFANPKQSHSCTKLTVEEYLKGKHPEIVALYFAFESAIRRCGDVRVHPAKSRIGFIARMTFASAVAKRDHLEVGLILAHRSDSPRVHRFFAYGPGGLHNLKLKSTADIDTELRRWIDEAYRVGLQEKQAKIVTPVTTESPRRVAPLRQRRKHPGKVFYFHWNEKELEERCQTLRSAGHDVRGHWSTQVTAKFGEYVPDVFVISLDRLPSHGRGYAAWIWEAKKRQSIPIIFAGGEPEKVDLTRHQFPNAVFCAANEVAHVIASLV